MGAARNRRRGRPPPNGLLRPAHAGVRQRRLAGSPSPGWLEKLDYRLREARRLRETFEQICEDLGGSSRLSTAQRMLVERCTWLDHYLRKQEELLAQDSPEFDIRAYTQAVYGLRSTLETVGLERRPRDVSLPEYLASVEQEETPPSPANDQEPDQEDAT
ncbi:MAG: hypothetical protein ACOC9E_00860 [Chloroflexota bacterium]